MVGFAVALVTHAFAVGQAPFAIAVGTVGFGFVGFFPLLLAVLQRPGRYLVSLRIDAASFTLARSSGGPRTLRWDDPGLTITVLQPEYLLGTGGPASEAEDLMVMPGLIEGALGPEARTALFTAARAHGLAYGEERYTRPGNRRGSAAVPVLARSAARPPAPGPRPVVAPEPIGDPPTTTGDGPRTFDLTHVPPPEFGDETVGTNSLARLSVAADGIELVDRKGRTLRRAWTAPELQIDLLRRLTSPLDRLDRRTAR